METLMNALFKVIERLLDENRSLYKESERHKKALIEGDISLIDAVVQKMSTHIASISSLEEDRQKLTANLADTYQVPASDVSVSFLLGRLDAKSAAKLQKLSTELQTVVIQLAESNNQNRMLLQTSLQYLNKTVEMVSSVASQDSYGPKKTTQVGVRLFDVQA